jgi:hypothetical protein
VSSAAASPPAERAELAPARNQLLVAVQPGLGVDLEDGVHSLTRSDVGDHVRELDDLGEREARAQPLEECGVGRRRVKVEPVGIQERQPLPLGDVGARLRVGDDRQRILLPEPGGTGRQSEVASD